MPNRGHSELIPPSGSRTPCTRKYPHAPTIAAEVAITPGIQLVRPSGADTFPSRSWSMNRPTRVPASISVRMNRASNMMAKWYQKPITAWPPPELAKMCAIPSASDGAPPVRENSVCSPTLCASDDMSPTVTGKPQPEMVATAAAGVAPTIPAGEFTAKYTPGCSTHAATIAMMATKLSSSMLPYPTGQAFDSLEIIFGVVPEEISEWKPEM